MSRISKKKKSRSRSDTAPRPIPGRRSKGVHTRLALLVFSILFALVLSEVIVRVVYGEKFGKRPGFFVADQKLGWRPAPFLDHEFYGPDYSIEVKTNADGCRLGALGEVDYSKDLVLLCGDSFTFGWGVSTGETFASYLDELVYEASDGRMRVVNLGVGGYGTIQHCDRLKDFLSKHGDSRIVCVIVQHSANDATDNPRSIGYHAETWETVTTSGSRSRFHLVNLCAYVYESTRRNDGRRGTRSPEGATRDPYLQDMLWAFKRTGRVVYLPDDVVVGRMKIRLRGRVTADEMDIERTLRRQSLTKLQSEMVLGSVDCTNGALSTPTTAAAKIFHMFVRTDPDWYIKRITALIEQGGGTDDGRVVVLGRVPEGEYDKPIQNTHSGGHYNPEFNAYWATSVLTLLEEQGIISR